MDSNICEEIRNYVDNTLRADLYLAVKWRWFTRYYLAEYDEADVKACLQHMGVEVHDGGVVFLWAGEYYSRLIEALVEVARREGDVSILADLYREGA
jgi:hypothetical protein